PNFEPNGEGVFVIGQRDVPALGPGESNESRVLEFQLPDNLSEGTYYCKACADADKTVVELDEDNNCEINQLSIIVPVEASPNQPPDCTEARSSVDLLWPPNHKLVNISIDGITDPDGDQLSLSVTGITQDEPVNGLGDGDTSPDGFGVGTNQAQIRAERSGTGNGRVYYITFTADDEKGGVCTGQVTVGVPHDKGKGRIPIDDGQDYDSTQP
ncbi:MAG: CARDB domain-containing protein, partial [Thermodesulfobacteriota bacterium]|nr:CARDB domain-containing protein [Thermodesulfobacteriota bacterium]